MDPIQGSNPPQQQGQQQGGQQVSFPVVPSDASLGGMPPVNFAQYAQVTSEDGAKESAEIAVNFDLNAIPQEEVPVPVAGTVAEIPMQEELGAEKKEEILGEESPEPEKEDVMMPEVHFDIDFATASVESTVSSGPEIKIPEVPKPEEVVSVEKQEGIGEETAESKKEESTIPEVNFAVDFATAPVAAVSPVPVAEVPEAVIPVETPAKEEIPQDVHVLQKNTPLSSSLPSMTPEQLSPQDTTLTALYATLRAYILEGVSGDQPLIKIQDEGVVYEFSAMEQHITIVRKAETTRSLTCLAVGKDGGFEVQLDEKTVLSLPLNQLDATDPAGDAVRNKLISFTTLLSSHLALLQQQQAEKEKEHLLADLQAF